MDLNVFLKKRRSSKKQTAKNVAIGAGIGTAVGLAAGVLLAPKAGRETREDIVKTAKNTLETVKDGLNVAKDKIEELAKKEKEFFCGESSEKEEDVQFEEEKAE